MTLSRAVFPRLLEVQYVYLSRILTVYNKVGRYLRQCRYVSNPVCSLARAVFPRLLEVQYV